MEAGEAAERGAKKSAGSAGMPDSRELEPGCRGLRQSGETESALRGRAEKGADSGYREDADGLPGGFSRGGAQGFDLVGILSGGRGFGEEDLTD